MYEKGLGVKINYQHAFKWYFEAARQQYFKSQIYMAHSYKNGRGVAKAPKKAFKYFKMAADQGNAEALFQLGLAYQQGLGVEVDLNKSVSFIKQAARKDYSIAQHEWAKMIIDKDVTDPQDVKTAIEYFKKLAEENNPQALYQMGLF